MPIQLDLLFQIPIFTFTFVSTVATTLTLALESMKLLLAVTGSVAAIKTGLLIQELESVFPRIEIKLVLTQAAQAFLSSPSSSLMLPSVPPTQIFRDDDEFKTWHVLGDPVLHIELRKWADGLLIAPLDANTLAKIAHGLCDNLLSNIVRAWDPSKPMWLAPAMNTLMWQAPITRRQLGSLQDGSHFGLVHLIEPICKGLACQEIGPGAMASAADIASRVFRDFQNDRRQADPSNAAGIIN